MKRRYQVFFVVLFLQSSFIAEGSEWNQSVSNADVESSEGVQFVSSIERTSSEKNFSFMEDFFGWIQSVFYVSKKPSEKSQLDSDKKTTLNIESVFSLNKNQLLPEPYAWTVDKPEFELFLSYPFARNSFFKAHIFLFHRNNKWDYFFHKLLVYYTLPFPFPLHLQLGYFDYPVSYTAQNRSEFARELLMEKVLFPSVRRASGVLLEGELQAPFYWRISLQGHTEKRKTDFTPNSGINPTITSSLIYKLKKQKAFFSYIAQDSFFYNTIKGFGAGANLFYDLEPFLFRFRGEFWRVRRDHPSQKLISFYVFPSVKWGQFAFGTLFGGTYHYLQKDQSRSLEYILKGDFYLTENIIFTIERGRKQELIVRENFWSFYLTTEFDIL